MMVEEQVAETWSEVPAPPATTHRRPRVREVSSRFMSPLNSSSSSGDHKRSSSVQKQRRQLEFEPLSCADSDDNIRNSSETMPKISTSSPTTTTTTTHRKHQQQPQAQRQRQRHRHPVSVSASLNKHFKENNASDCAKQLLVSGRYANFTPSAPNPMLTSMDRMVPSRFRLTPMPMPMQMQRPSSINATPTPTPTAAAKLLQSSLSAQPKLNASLQPTDSSSSSSSSVAIHNNNNNNNNSVPHLRSSMPEADLLPTVSNRLNNGIVGDSSKFPASPCSRSLNLPLSTSENSLFHSIKGTEKSAPTLPKPYTNSVKIGGLCLPPVPPYAKLGTDARKGRKVSNHQEDVHSLRMLHNHYLQWRYANVKAEASMQAQKTETERTLYSLGMKISDLYDSVKRKRIELGLLQRAKNLTTILEAEMPYLDEWSALEEDYSLSLSEAIQALLNASIQLPISGNIRVDLREVGEALSCATKLMETIVFHVQSFMPKADEMEILTSELARVTGGERSLIEDYGDLLSRTYNLQVEECSLRSQLIQLHQSCPGQFREDEQ